MSAENVSRTITLGSPRLGTVHYTLTVWAVSHFYADAGSANSLCGGLPTAGRWVPSGDSTFEVRHRGGECIVHEGTKLSPAALKRELARAITLLAGWTLLSDSAGLLDVGSKAA